MQANFSEHAKRALENAHSAAGELGHRYLGSEHLLLGLILTQDSAAANILEEAGVTFDAAKEKLCALCETGEPVTTDTAEITPRAQRILQGAVYESAKYQKETGTEYILLALASDGDSLAARILQLLGVEMGALYKACRDYIRECEKVEGTAEKSGGRHGRKAGKHLAKYGHDLTEDAKNKNRESWRSSNIHGKRQNLTCTE